MKFRLDFVALGLLSLIFFVSASILVWQNPTTYNSPDENANATLASVFGQTGKLWMDEPLNIELNNLLHPRSVISISSHLVPVSFLGLPVIYGFFSRMVGIAFVGLLTPLLATLAVFAWRAMMERLFHSRVIAFFSSLAVLFHPSFWYYSGRLFMHNVPFVACLIFAIYFAMRHGARPITHHRAGPILCGFFLGLALWFRTSELLWVIPSALALLIAFRRQLGFERALFVIATALVVLAPLPFLNNALYGGPFETGYTAGGENVEYGVSHADATKPTELTSPIFHFPITLHFSRIPSHVYHYALELFPWLSIAAALGFLLILSESHGEREKKIYNFLALGVTAWLFLFYGSWSFNDNPDPTLVTIGTSYLRYWLPAFILWSPYVARFLVWCVERMRTAFTRRAMIGFLSLLLVGLSVHPVFFAADGLARVRENVATFATKKDRILALTPSSSIIIVDRADKFLWPARRVVQPLRSDSTYEAMPSLIANAPLYYFGITLPSWDIDYLNNEKLKAQNLGISLVEEVGDESLYHIYEVADTH